MPRKKNLPFGFEEGEQNVTIVKHRLWDKSASSLSSKELDLSSPVIQRVCQRDVKSRKQQ
jgi:hypothetical protein